MATKMREFIVKVFYRQDAKGEYEHNRSDLTEEVVRCKHCRYWWRNGEHDGDPPHRMCVRDAPEWFCADGERRADV